MKALLTILTLLTSLWFDFTKIHQQNDHLDQIYQAYFDQNFMRVMNLTDHLHDSLQFMTPETKLNKANAHYKLSRFNNLEGAAVEEKDSVYLNMVTESMRLYGLVFDSDKVLNSVSYNQQGIVIFKTKVMNGQEVDLTQAMKASIEYFKSALIENPENEDARYNYELINKYLKFPEVINTKVEHLIKTHRYRDAFNLLKPWVENDIRFSDKKDYLSKLEIIVTIDENF